MGDGSENLEINCLNRKASEREVNWLTTQNRTASYSQAFCWKDANIFCGHRRNIFMRKHGYV